MPSGRAYRFGVTIFCNERASQWVAVSAFEFRFKKNVYKFLYLRNKIKQLFIILNKIN